MAAFVAGRFQGSNSGLDGWPCRGEVSLHAPASAVIPWARHGVVEELGPDRCRLVPGAWSRPGLAATIGSLDADIDVVGPPELKRAFAHLSQRHGRAGIDGHA